MLFASITMFTFYTYPEKIANCNAHTPSERMEQNMSVGGTGTSGEGGRGGVVGAFTPRPQQKQYL